jgi:hypothetical protein
VAYLDKFMPALVEAWRKSCRDAVILKVRHYPLVSGAQGSAPEAKRHLSATGGTATMVQDLLDQRALGQRRDCDPVPGSAASAKRISAESECKPVFFMTAARWFSTVRWLMPRSAAMFLLGWPASTSSMIWR